MQSVLAVKKIVYNANKIWHYFGSMRMCWLCTFLVGSKQDLRPNVGIIWLPAKNFACILAFWQSTAYANQPYFGTGYLHCKNLQVAIHIVMVGGRR